MKEQRQFSNHNFFTRTSLRPKSDIYKEDSLRLSASGWRPKLTTMEHFKSSFIVEQEEPTSKAIASMWEVHREILTFIDPIFAPLQKFPLKNHFSCVIIDNFRSALWKTIPQGQVPHAFTSLVYRAYMIFFFLKKRIPVCGRDKRIKKQKPDGTGTNRNTRRRVSHRDFAHHAR